MRVCMVLNGQSIKVNSITQVYRKIRRIYSKSQKIYFVNKCFRDNVIIIGIEKKLKALASIADTAVNCSNKQEKTEVHTQKICRTLLFLAGFVETMCNSSESTSQTLIKICKTKFYK